MPTRQTGSAPPLSRVLATLRRMYGPVPHPLSRDPFALILAEQVAYLATDEKRRAAFHLLAREVGTTPNAIAAAQRRTLVRIAKLGGSIAAEERAARMARSAQHVIDKYAGDLWRAAKLPRPAAVRALSKFPMIGTPGAERVLAQVGAHATFGLDSNGLRVCMRYGWGKDGGGYAKAYQSASSALEREWPTKPRQAYEAAWLLRRHGQETCTRSHPSCDTCALAASCRYAQSG